MRTLLYYLALIAVTAIIWTQIYSAQFQDYDENFGQLISAMLLSTITTAITGVLWFRKTQIIKMKKIETMVFILINNPFTVALVIMNYNEIFGTTLNT